MPGMPCPRGVPSLLLPVMDIILVMLPRLELVDLLSAEEACCMPMKAAAKLLTNLAELPVEERETMTWATVPPAGLDSGISRYATSRCLHSCIGWTSHS